MPATKNVTEINPNVTLGRFLASWSLDRIRRMTVSNYADLGNHDSLCYWLEYGTKDLGQIGRVALHKFELWKSDPARLFKDGRFKRERGYAWNANKGANMAEAFETIRRLIIRIIEHSHAGDWEALDGVPFHAIGKWKIAFLFSDSRLLPIYSDRALRAVANGLGLVVAENATISALQTAILAQRPPEENMFAFAGRLYFAYAERPRPRKFFVIGSNYEGVGSVMSAFLERSCVAMGWVDWVDFSGYMGCTRSVVGDFVDEHYQEKKPSPSKIKGYFRTFSEISEGDLIAVKSQGAYNALTIIAYAQVVKRDGNIYFHDEGDLGHCIHVEFLDSGFSKFVGANYAQTIHRFSADKDGDTFYEVFGWYGVEETKENSVSVPGNVDVEPPPDPEDDPNVELPPDEGYNEKSEDAFERSAGATVIVNKVHSKMQNSFIRFLRDTFPDHAVSGEKRYVDAKRVTGDQVFLYEIKPDVSVYTCIRAGIGQLLDYRFQDASPKPKTLVIVGQGEPTPDDVRFIEDIKATLRVPFFYVAFNQLKMQATTY